MNTLKELFNDSKNVQEVDFGFHIPEHYIRLYASEFRSVTGLSSLSLSIIAAATFFKKGENKLLATMIQILGILFLIFTLTHGIRVNNYFKNYLAELSTIDGMSPFYQRRIKEWYAWTHHLDIYFIFIITITTAYVFHQLLLFYKRNENNIMKKAKKLFSSKKK